MQHEKNGIFYWTYGDEKKPPLVMIHGFTGSHEGFSYIIPHLKDYFVIIPDLPGFGVSRPLEAPWTIDNLARVTNEFVHSLELRVHPFLVSHSMGGLVAASMLAQQPELFDQKTIFISPVPNRISWRDGRKAGALAGRLQYAVGHHIPRIATSKLISAMATQALLRTKDTTLRRRIRQHHFKNLEYISSSKFYEKLHVDITKRGTIDYAPKLQRFATLIITGSRDNVTPLKHEKVLASALQATLHIIPGTGHLAHYEHPEEIAVHIKAHLQKK